MILRVIAVGKLKERHWQDGVADYARRLKPYARLELLEITEARIPEGALASKETEAMEVEARAILEKESTRSALPITDGERPNGPPMIQVISLFPLRISF